MVFLPKDITKTKGKLIFEVTSFVGKQFFIWVYRYIFKE